MGVSYLVDTHVLLWLLGSPDRVPAGVRETLSDPTVALHVSAASALEVATKTRTGKLQAVGLVESWDRRLSDIGVTELTVTSEHALMAGSMTWEHRDPFDRLLVAQAVIEGLVLVTVDRAMTGLPAPRVLTW
ncbi:type II toxin-antitoxin system VapC family toxin [Luteipulveratus mongoliensis]|uniref:Twitching motility protein PilT n=1 Tax=Luteipulveratus mongoliensis TaxID=571913 RepID=A0A0K1JFP0_9MICO|nr:type II toxin-antitoxin system VapC family toxin [Luteipulveratus mongoliensis]AKU15537.1 twitching motility protein PilT [Luteipulveratus mongoliensis]